MKLNSINISRWEPKQSSQGSMTKRHKSNKSSKSKWITGHQIISVSFSWEIRILGRYFFFYLEYGVNFLRNPLLHLHHSYYINHSFFGWRQSHLFYCWEWFSIHNNHTYLHVFLLCLISSFLIVQSNFSFISGRIFFQLLFLAWYCFNLNNGIGFDLDWRSS